MTLCLSDDMKFEITKDIFGSFPGLVEGILIVKGIDNKDPDDSMMKLIRAREVEIRKEFTKDRLSEEENISAWRKAYSSFGAKPSKYKSSVEALFRRILDGDDLPEINKLVDIYNYISIKHAMPAGADDLKNIDGDIRLKISDGTERFLPLNSENPETPKENEVIYADDKDVLCRRWNWRECNKSKLTEDTTNTILYVESLVGKKKLEAAMKELKELIEDKFNVRSDLFIMDKDCAILDIDALKLTATDYKIEKKTEKLTEKKEKKKKERRPKDVNKDDTFHWADQVAKRIIILKGDKREYTVASGITPSGTVHIGNFREIITTELVARALRKLGKKVRFIYSWDDYDVFRKVPVNMPKKDILEKHLRQAITDVPDTYDCGHDNYARHNEIAVEETLPTVGIEVEFISQSEMYRKCSYTEGMRKALENTEKIKAILDEHRKEPLHKDWLPVAIFCEKCGKDTVTKITYEGGTILSYKCDCGHESKLDFSKKGNAKLKWRIDWPMRWAFEDVDFEPGGKDHSAHGGSRMTGELIAKDIYDGSEPVYQVYEWIQIKGGQQFSSSAGVATTLNDCLDIYEPAIVRYIFAGTRPSSGFAISFDLDVFKIYEDFDKCERIYFGAEKVKNPREFEKQKRIYELSAVDQPPKKLPVQISIRHLTNILQTYENDIEKTKEFFKDDIKDKIDEQRFVTRARCTINWLEKYAPEEFKFKVQDKVSVDVSEKEKAVMKKVAQLLKKGKIDEKELHNQFYEFSREEGIEPQEFFKAAYKVLINKEKGPKLAAFLIILGPKAIDLFESA